MPSQLSEFLKSLEEHTPEYSAELQKLPTDVQKVVADFEADYRLALKNFRESLLGTFAWAGEAQNQLHLLVTYLRTEQMKSELNLNV